MDRKEIDKILSGNTSRTTLIGYEPKKEHTIRKVGEIWYETNPVTGHVTRWEQKQGYRIKSAANTDGLKQLVDEVKFWNCPKETCTCTTPSRLDEKYRLKFGMCSDCQISKETMMKINGEYAQYEKERLKTNLLAWLKDAEADKELLKQSIEKDYETITEFGDSVKWEMQGKEEYLKKIDEEWEKFKNGLFKMYEIEGIE